MKISTVSWTDIQSGQTPNTQEKMQIAGMDGYLSLPPQFSFATGIIIQTKNLQDAYRNGFIIPEMQRVNFPWI